MKGSVDASQTIDGDGSLYQHHGHSQSTNPETQEGSYAHAHSGFKTHTGGFMRTKEVKHGRGNSVSRVPAGYHGDEAMVNQGDNDMTAT
jgi:hypothetical protein